MSLTDKDRQSQHLSADKRERMAPLGRSLTGFLGAGAIGFLSEALLLTLLVNLLGWPPIYSRVVSFPVALTATWLLNRGLVFPGRGPNSLLLEYAGYVGVQASGAVINLGTYVACVYFLPLLSRVPVVPLAIGSVAAMAFNFIALRWFLYRSRS